MNPHLFRSGLYSFGTMGSNVRVMGVRNDGRIFASIYQHSSGKWVVRLIEGSVIVGIYYERDWDSAMKRALYDVRGMRDRKVEKR